MELEAMSRYTSPVNPAVFPHLTVVLLAIGMFFTAWFFVYPLAEGVVMGWGGSGNGQGVLSPHLCYHLNLWTAATR
uniref:Dolichyl-diphosphooligosaccharide-protein glycosyltransferase subunit TMEM258 n=1 Tax=Strigops habroptila TaxID=2489341 RepID=A0A672V425_STRHB